MSAITYESVDQGAVMIRVSMATVKDRQALTDLNAFLDAFPVRGDPRG